MEIEGTNHELLELNQRLLDAITGRDWETYTELSAESLTAFEPEAIGHRVDGLAFHEFYFQSGGARGTHQTTMIDPHVRIMGDAAVVTYVRLHQKRDVNQGAMTTGSMETRIWQKIDGKWQHVHFHRSPLPTGWSEI